MATFELLSAIKGCLGFRSNAVNGSPTAYDFPLLPYVKMFLWLGVNPGIHVAEAWEKNAPSFIEIATETGDILLPQVYRISAG